MDINESLQQLTNWLSHPNELGKKPSKVEFTKQFKDEEGIQCQIFKYKKSMFSKWYLAIVSESGTFSEFKEYHEGTEVEDATEILTMLKNYWKDMAKQFADQE